MIQKIGDLGGKYSPSLNRECTHLIVAHPKPAAPDPLSSAKVRWAFQVNAQAREEREYWALQEETWRRRGGGSGGGGGDVGVDPMVAMPGRDKERERGIKVVWEGWFWDCLHFEGRFKEDAWNAEEVGEPPAFEQSYTYRGEQGR
jgi:DNA replication regulator DPB11